MINFISPNFKNKPVLVYKKKNRVIANAFFSLLDINEAIDLKCTSEVIYLDFREPFDSVPHKEFIGITGLLWLWLKSYHSHIYHYVSLNKYNFSLPSLLRCATRNHTGPFYSY